MNKDWDKVVVPTSTWKECLRVMEPGSFAFIMSSPRQDVLSRMICNLQDAGFETGFTSIYWTYASGFPKAMNMKKRGIEGAYAGFQPKPAVEVILVCMKPLSEKSYVDQALANAKGVTWLDDCRIPYQSEDEPNSRHGGIRLDPADGWNQNHMIRDFDPNQKGRFPANLICGSRLTYHIEDLLELQEELKNAEKISYTKDENGSISLTEDGRLVLDYFGLTIEDLKRMSSEELIKHCKRFSDVLNDGRNYKTGDLTGNKPRAFGDGNIYGVAKTKNPHYHSGDSGSFSRYFDLDKWFETTFPFAIIPKASKKERNMGLITSYFEGHKVNDGRKTPIDNPFQRGETIRVNTHPTVKPLKLMAYLIMLGSREGDVILDPFAGSGTTGIAARMLHRQFIGLEINKEYTEVVSRRLEHYLLQAKLPVYDDLRTRLSAK